MNITHAFRLAIVLVCASASWAWAQEQSSQNADDPAPPAAVNEPFIQEAPSPGLSQGNCVFAVEQVDPAELTVEEQIAMADRLFNESLHASNDCLTEVQSEAASGGYAGGGGGLGGASGTGGAAGAASAGQVDGQMQSGNDAQNETEPVGNGRMDQGSIETDADKQICDELRAQAKSARTESERADIVQAAKEFGCRAI